MTEPTAADLALDRLFAGLREGASEEAEARQDAATIREALADRITPAEARYLLGRGPSSAQGIQTIRARLGRIADRDEVTR